MSRVGAAFHQPVGLQARDDPAEMCLVHVEAPADVGGRLFPGSGELVEHARFRQGEGAGRHVPIEQAQFMGVEAVEVTDIVDDGHGRSH